MFIFHYSNILHMCKASDFTSLPLYRVYFLKFKEDDSGTKINGNVHKIIANPIVETLENP